MPLSAAADCEAFHTEVVLGKGLNELPFPVDVSVTVFSKRSWAVVPDNVLERWDGGRLSVKLLVYNAAECRYLGPVFLRSRYSPCTSSGSLCLPLRVPCSW